MGETERIFFVESFFFKGWGGLEKTKIVFDVEFVAYVEEVTKMQDRFLN